MVNRQFGIMGWESVDVVRFDLGPCLQGQTKIAKLKSAYNSLIMVLQVWDGKQNYKKSLGGTLLVWSDSILDPSFKVKQGQRNLKVPITRLLLVLEVWGGKPTYRKSWAENLFVWSDLTLDPDFKVK